MGSKKKKKQNLETKVDSLEKRKKQKEFEFETYAKLHKLYVSESTSLGDIKLKSLPKYLRDLAEAVIEYNEQLSKNRPMDFFGLICVGGSENSLRNKLSYAKECMTKKYKDLL